jgi:hypothetical protein
VEKDRDTVRPFRVWDARERKLCVGRNYVDKQNAMDGALLMIRRQLCESLEVFDIRTGKLIAQYVRKPTSIAIWEAK